MRNPALDRVLATALALALLPVSAKAAAPPEAAEPIRDQFDPVPIEAAPLPAPAPEPAPEPQPEPRPEPPPPAIEGPTPAELTKVRTTRRASIGLMATGGSVAVVGLGVTIAFTFLAHHEQNARAPRVEDIEHSDAAARVGGILLASGIAVVAVGGILFVSARKKAESLATARIRVTPTIGGLAVSGRF
jgi:hypothetical protein